ncbi:MAG: hypothetical protein AB7L09_00700 [Nitrospira sp.]
MARAVDRDPFHCFRFAPRVGFGGKPMGVAKVEVLPGKPWMGRGEVHITSAWKPEFVEFGKLAQPFPLVIGVYHITDEFGVDAGPPSGHMVCANVTPALASMEITPLDAMSDSILEVKIKLDYDRLSFIFGDNPLDKITALV